MIPQCRRDPRVLSQPALELLLHLPDALARHVHQATNVLERHPVPVAVLAPRDVERARLLHREEVVDGAVEGVGGGGQLEGAGLRDVEEEVVLAARPGARPGALDAVTARLRPARAARITHPVLRGYWEAEGDGSGAQDASHRGTSADFGHAPFARGVGNL